jgi:hypothetical protein
MMTESDNCIQQRVLSDDEKRWMRARTGQPGGVIVDAVRRIGNSTLHALDVFDLFTGGAERHGICNKRGAVGQRRHRGHPDVVVPPHDRRLRAGAFRLRDGFGPVAR